MSSQAHIIGKQRLKIQVQDRSKAYDIQSRVLEVFKQRVLPRMEAKMDSLSKPDEVIRIDSLQLDLGNIPLENLEASFPDLVEEKLLEAIDKLQKDKEGQKLAGYERFSSNDSKIGRLEEFLAKGILGWSAGKSGRDMSNLLEELIAKHPVALRNELGRMASPEKWYQRRRLVLQFSSGQVQQLLSLLDPSWERLAPRLVNELVKFLSEFPILEGPLEGRRLRLVWERILDLALAKAFPKSAPALLREMRMENTHLAPMMQAKTETLQVIAVKIALSILREEAPVVQSLTTRLAGMPASRLAALPARLSESEGRKDPMSEVWRALIEGNLAFSSPKSGEMPSIAAPEVGMRKQSVASVIAERLVANAEVVTEEWLSAAIHALARAWRGAAQAEKGSKIDIPGPAELLEALAEIAPAARKLKIEPRSEVAEIERQAKGKSDGVKKAEKRKLPKTEHSDGVFIENAGLVILNPFLPAFFDRLGWVKDGQFNGIEEQEKAVSMLHYLSSGETTAPEEHTLVLNKLMVGLDLNYPVGRDWQPDEEMREMADLVLGSAVHNWPRIGNISGDELRETFLRRDGKLSEKGGNWQLKVERKTLDVLLDFLPWSFGVLRLPWMKTMVTVDW